MLLREGHDGVFEMTVDGKVIYTNDRVCGRLPAPDRILDLIELHTGRSRRDPAAWLGADAVHHAPAGTSGCGGPGEKGAEDGSRPE